ncbi:ABC transporter ATP-binding protein [Opitutaceae bacterium TAV5]|nr:ABC transporter ATP-binding protein [Opitutaceae bacterium TAV5]
MKASLHMTWKLIRPWWVSDERWAARGLFTLVLGLDLSRVYTAARISYWQKNFYDALTNYDMSVVRNLLLELGIIASAGVLIDTSRIWFYQSLEIRWRGWMTDVFLHRWLSGSMFHRVETGHRADNPDQRIAEDLREMVRQTLELTLGFIRNCVNLVSFCVIIWGISGTLTFALFGVAVNIPGYMLWAAVIYALVVSIVMEKLGSHMVAVEYQHQQCEADFRFLMVRVRENSAQIALSEGGPAERIRLAGLFGAVRENWSRVMVFTRRVTAIERFYIELGAFIPYLLIIPRYFAREITLGALMQLTIGFSRVRGGFSWFIFQYKQLATLRSVYRRLIEFDAILSTPETAVGITVTRSGRPALSTHDLALALPDGKLLTRIGAVTFAPGSRWLIRGVSGVGKSTFLRAIAGLWPHGSGNVDLPEGRLMFLPQESYLPLGTLKAALCYPKLAEAFSDTACIRVLELCELGVRAGDLDVDTQWARRLSPGEKQRLAFARALLHRPDFLFMDEATSALDPELEHRLMTLLLRELSSTAVVSVAHRETMSSFHQYTLKIVPADLAAQPESSGLPLAALPVSRTP